MARECIFCGKSEVTREHVLSKWMFAEKKNRRAVKPTGYVSDGMAPLAVQTFDEKFIERPVVDNSKLTCRCVCASCNNGWMSELETTVKNIVELSGWGAKPLRANTYERKRLEKWMVVKFLVMCHSMGLKQALQVDFAKNIFKDRKTESIHLDCFLGEHYAVDFSIVNCRSHPEMPKGFQQHTLDHSIAFCAQLGHLYIRLIMAGPHKKHELLLLRYKTKKLRSDYDTTFIDRSSDPSVVDGTKGEFALFCYSVLVILKDLNMR